MHFVNELERFMETDKLIWVEIVYADSHQQKLLKIQIKEGASIQEAIYLSGILHFFPKIDLTQQKVGIFNKIKKLEDKIQSGDRIEIYRPLHLDPKEARRRRVKKA